jgi:tetratricopeptide (TPR) repeat protein
MNMKKTFGILILILCVFFIIKKIYQLPEKLDVKRINKLYYAGEFEKAKNELEAHIKTYSGSSQSWTYLGLVKLELNDTLGAELAYRKGFELDKENDKAIVGLGIIERMKGNYAKARQYYESAMAINPNNPDCYASLLILEIKNKNYSKAVELGEKARGLSLTKTRPGILGNLVIAYHLNHQIKERDNALAELQKMNYPDIKYTEMIINNELDVNDFL